MKQWSKNLGKTAATVVLAIFLTACGSPINQQNYDKIQNDMTLEQVTAILGPASESQSAGVGPLSGTQAVWKDKSGFTITILFVNDKVKMKNSSKQ